MERVPVLEHDHWPQSISAEDEQPDPDTLLMVPPTIFGHNMETRTWMTLHVDRLKEVDWDTECFRWLVMPQEQKDMLQALMRAASQSRSSNDGTDFIRGKGQGLAILCHGAPGTGKSLSAECLAENAQKPLYHVTCGEIGFSPQAFERHLSKVMQQAERWDAILLLDEADIFLQLPYKKHAEGDALEAVFLRALEYHSGTIVLTTTHDALRNPAFISRINVAIYYETLNRTSRQNIWGNMLKRYEMSSRRPMIGDLHEHLTELAEFKLNGRQIRNAFQTAAGLADYNGSPLSYRHFLQTIKMVNNYVTLSSGGDSSILPDAPNNSQVRITDIFPDTLENTEVRSASDVIELFE
ncbi:P-loop containing nucleoside triphosphate hydrolase protein [Paraphoma chrysanthemicola]|uniref:P-loop containing nucleoside triphosphate hydrolase protein n=1 Tax=Paraphoma chrysanthemicola TaxID=798071 RepID=A0A8K0RE49_9PLEO|nr:P-loop containing nucleoside triphosphate hydrolase protein [Paraphoma chrysanthemicola]